MVDLGVGITVGFAVSIAGLSVYVSRIFLPKKIKRAYLKSITALAVAVETKDSGTVGHAQRVARLTVEVGRRLGMSNDEAEQMEYASLLMDMGKANVPQSLLNKQGALTPEEWEVLKSHPRLGAEMVAAVPFLAGLKDFVLYHHEYWDGSGYPKGLKGEEIPLVSRILCVSADYDAMVSDRPYHPRRLTIEEAAEEIKKSSGTKYDPKVVEVFLKMLAAMTSETAKAA